MLRVGLGPIPRTEATEGSSVYFYCPSRVPRHLWSCGERLPSPHTQHRVSRSPSHTEQCLCSVPPGLKPHCARSWDGRILYSRRFPSNCCYVLSCSYLPILQSQYPAHLLMTITFPGCLITSLRAQEGGWGRGGCACLFLKGSGAGVSHPGKERAGHRSIFGSCF